MTMNTSKKFKEYDKKYRHLVNSFTLEELSKISEEHIEEHAAGLRKWGFTPEPWTKKFIRYSVYEAADHEEWQQFRVSMKGQSTQVKIYRLISRRTKAIIQGDSNRRDRELCRIDNYIGALVRGGFLNSKLEIVR